MSGGRLTQLASRIDAGAVLILGTRSDGRSDEVGAAKIRG